MNKEQKERLHKLLKKLMAQSKGKIVQGIALYNGSVKTPGDTFGLVIITHDGEEYLFFMSKDNLERFGSTILNCCRDCGALN